MPTLLTMLLGILPAQEGPPIPLAQVLQWEQNWMQARLMAQQSPIAAAALPTATRQWGEQAASLANRTIVGTGVVTAAFPLGVNVRVNGRLFLCYTRVRPIGLQPGQTIHIEGQLGYGVIRPYAFLWNCRVSLP